MKDENFGVNEHYPTERGTAGRPHDQDATQQDSRTSEKPPRSNAAARTGGCTGPRPRPVAQSGCGADNTADAGVEILEDTEVGDPRAEPQLLEQLRVANAFDAAERAEPRPETLQTELVYGYRLRVEGDSRGEWLRTTHALKLGEMR
ncbi:hypothetical protein C482_15518 [Natrialba chahannaoensis JCM 10990]|uniref:Uncharacterized protein n=1 Tax=Natrialba chahannaoensis JCM 10990 TaxID=1227492 RepID=M0AGQ3_9EURY|nr:hypothetical protein [Natrialba chahannaoensis]ELY96548.1 hypothetical protein C482_15518 [Natrialba chahannaoensis JCM 10990]